MSQHTGFVRRFFRLPNDPSTKTTEIVDQAAAAHSVLLNRALRAADRGKRSSLDRLAAVLNKPALAPHRQRLFCHPLLIEALHGLAGVCPELKRWHDSVARPSVADIADSTLPASGTAEVGNIVLALLLRAQRCWRGELDLCTDLTGRLRFPFSDWSMALYLADAQPGSLLVRQCVRLSVEDQRTCWSLQGSRDSPFLIMSRDDCLGMVVHNDEGLEARRLAFPDPRVRPRLQFATPLGYARVRYDPIYLQDFDAHAGLTGAIVQRVLEAMEQNSPTIHHEFCCCIHTIRGFELPESRGGVIRAFSDPTLPGVMGINIPYTSSHEPCLSPFCFTWFGHELAHTKNYLLDTVAYREGSTFLRNSTEFTDRIPRYGRALSVRTLFQIPYVHLYEWTLLMDFIERRFGGLPWKVGEDPVPVGDDLQAEIEESFDLIARCARLTLLGNAALSHFRKLFLLTAARWRGVRSRVATSKAAVPLLAEAGEALAAGR
ncbi:MAG: hypothetical protein HY000_19235 [Planctomycetes bacterium]|nr:hypothetical protein [Planctomycetota bacterium]